MAINRQHENIKKISKMLQNQQKQEIPSSSSIQHAFSSKDLDEYSQYPKILKFSYRSRIKIPLAEPPNFGSSQSFMRVLNMTNRFRRKLKKKTKNQPEDIVRFNQYEDGLKVWDLSKSYHEPNWFGDTELCRDSVNPMQVVADSKYVHTICIRREDFTRIVLHLEKKRSQKKHTF